MSRFNARVLLALSLSAAPALAQTAPAGAAQPATERPVTIAPERPFTLEEAIAIGLRESFNLQLQGLSLENAKENVVIQEANFLPTLSASATRGTTQQASSTDRLDGTGGVGRRDDSTSYSAGVQQRIPWTNGTVNISADAGRRANNSSNSTFNPQYTNGVSMTFNQPLLADFGREAALAQLENVRIAYRIQTINYKNQILNTITAIEDAYYNLVAQREALRIRQLALDSSQRLFDENQARRSTGVMTDLDVLNAEVGVARGQQSLIQQQQAVRDAEDRLLNAINAPSLDLRPGAVAFDDYRDGAPSFTQSYKLAREFFPSGMSQEENIKQLELTLRNARRTARPNVDLTARLGYTARTSNEGFVDVIGNLVTDHGNNWSLGLNYSVPWGQRADKARVRIAENNVASGKIQLDQLESQLMVDVRAAVRAIETQMIAVEAAMKATELSVKQYDQQKARFEAGLATAFLVLEAQEQLENARFTELNAKLSLRRAVSALRRLEGTSLERFRVELPQP